MRSRSPHERSKRNARMAVARELSRLPTTTSTQRSAVRIVEPASTASPPATTATAITTSATSATVASHLVKSRVYLLLRLGKDSHKITSLCQAVSKSSRIGNETLRSRRTNLFGICEVF